MLPKGQGQTGGMTFDTSTCGRTVCFNNRKSLTATQKRATALIITQFSCNCLTEGGTRKFAAVVDRRGIML